MRTEIFDTYEDFLAREDKNLNGVSKDIAEQYPGYEKDNQENIGCWDCYDLENCILIECKDISECSNLRYMKRCSRMVACSHMTFCFDLHAFFNTDDCKNMYHCKDLIACKELSFCSYMNKCEGLFNCHRIYDGRTLKRLSNCQSIKHIINTSYCEKLINCQNINECFDARNAENLKNYYKNKEIGDIIVPEIKNIHTQLREVVNKEGNVIHMDAWHLCETIHCWAGWVVELAGEPGKKLESYTHTSFAAMSILLKSSDIRVRYNDFYLENKEALEKIENFYIQEQHSINKIPT